MPKLQRENKPNVYIWAFHASKKMKIILQILIAIFLSFPILANGQNIYSAIHLNDKEKVNIEIAEKIIETNTFYNQSGKQVKKNIKYLNANNQCLREDRFEDEELIARLTYSYDSITNLVTSRTFERWNKIIGYTKEKANYIYNYQNHLVRIEDVNANNFKFRETKIIPNKKGHPISMKVFNGNEEQFSGEEQAEYIYNQNQYISIKLDLERMELSRDTAILDFNENHKFNDPRWEYNETGDLIKSIRNSTEYFIYEYKYDNFGNWKSQKIYKVKLNKRGKWKKKLDRKFQRKIEYKK